MSEILKAAYAKPRAINQNKHHHLVNKGDWPKYIWDVYPIAQDYYHEMNPYFVHLIPDKRLIPEFPVFTVRDGIYAFADFMLKSMKDLATWKTNFIIPESYAPLVPDNLREKFFSSSSSQVRQPDIRKAKTVIVFGLLCDQYFGSYEKIAEKLSVLKDLPGDVKLEVCISQRRNPLSVEERENMHYINVPELIRKIVGNREIKWLLMRELMDKTVLRDSYLIDLMDGDLITCDSYLHFWFLARGGSIHQYKVWNKKPSLLEIDVNLNQKLEIRKLPDLKANIADLIFYSKIHKGDIHMTQSFHEEVRKAISV